MPSFNRRNFLTLTASAAVAASLGFVSSSAFAAKPQIFTGLVKGVAVAGHDPVAYFTQGKPVEGSTEHSLVHEGAEWRFSSAENKAMFEANPAKYAPQYDGHCAYGVSKGGKVPGNPTLWRIVDDKLYLNITKNVVGFWEEDIPGNIDLAEGNWTSIEPAPASDRAIPKFTSAAPVN
mgnify:CR=1 FL=1